MKRNNTEKFYGGLAAICTILMGKYEETLIAGMDRALERNPDRTGGIYLGERFSYRR